MGEGGLHQDLKPDLHLGLGPERSIFLNLDFL